MKYSDYSTDPFAVRARVPANEGYLGSSLDLQAGLWVQELLVSACPPEVIHELARMRRSWPATVAPTTPAAA